MQQPLPGSLAADRSQRVLIVDDDESFAARLAAQVGGQQVVEQACTPELALDLARATSFGLVVIEPNLRGMAWVRLLRALRAAQPAADLVVVTAFASVAMYNEALQRGVRTFHHKPVALRTLIDSLKGAHARLVAPAHPAPQPTLDQHEWEYVNQVLRACDGNISETSRRLAIPRQSLYYKLRKQPRRPAMDFPAMGFVASADSAA
jgi:two-component system response regulator RegA